jgi:hypothetical protein
MLVSALVRRIPPTQEGQSQACIRLISEAQWTFIEQCIDVGFSAHEQSCWSFDSLLSLWQTSNKFSMDFSWLRNIGTFLRFQWHRDQDPRNELVEYRMCVHVFGHSPSPSVTTYGLRGCEEHSNKPEVREFFNNYFYVDNDLASFATEEEAVTVLKDTQAILLQEGKLKLHKIASNSANVMKSFHPEDLAGDLNTIDIGKDGLQM